MPRLTETRALRSKLPTEEEREKNERCSELTGFAAPILFTGHRSYTVTPRGHSRITIGKVGVFPFEGPADAPGARDLALIAINAARNGQDPKAAIKRARMPRGLTFAGLWKAYEEAKFPLLTKIGFKRASSIKVDSYRCGKHILPKIGDKLVADYMRNEPVQTWLDTIPDLGARSHALILAKNLLSFARRATCAHATTSV